MKFLDMVEFLLYTSFNFPDSLFLYLQLNSK